MRWPRKIARAARKLRGFYSAQSTIDRPHSLHTPSVDTPHLDPLPCYRHTMTRDFNSNKLASTERERVNSSLIGPLLFVRNMHAIKGKGGRGRSAAQNKVVHSGDNIKRRTLAEFPLSLALPFTFKFQFLAEAYVGIIRGKNHHFSI
eukprot:scaffold26652_cov151-Skeletonema_menzelii.AAC.3